MSKYKLLGVGTNAKTIKGDGDEYITAILYLKPSLMLCPMSKKAHCLDGCLYSAGRGAFNSVQESRTRKTKFLLQDRSGFMQTLQDDLDKFLKYCIKKDVQPVVRLNGTSDWNFLEIIRDNPDIQFYDYTKVYNRLDKNLPPNYHVTLSYSEANVDYKDKVVAKAKAKGVNIAVVFRDKKKIPTEFLGMRVVDGDQDDLRFLDPTGVVVALYAKGQAKKDTSGFVVDI
tara:strand:+ start:366 stop:1049 length:684 start_codon:yes stop_codon:yes gene_type:complete